MAAVAAAAVVEDSDEENSTWEDVLRKMLPPGAPIPDDAHLDYSIAIEYVGPPIPFEVPKVQPLELVSVPGAASGSAANVLSSPSQKEDSPRGSDGGDEEEEDETWSPRAPPALEPPGDVRRAQVVTFDTGGEESECLDSGEISYPVAPSPVARPLQRRENKRGVCSRCGKASILTERVACLVCDARFCSHCVLKAMGSMPEGRKCVVCIGRPIDESKRSTLGKPSRMLGRLCGNLEVKHIMRAERECPANQLRPEQLLVNGRRLRSEEMEELLGCRNPPQKLRPGRYWYDKDSGLWGKEGEKPSSIITSKLNVGGKLQLDASNGNANVCINGREITKTEHRMLKVAKVQCPRGTNFWVYDDGSYEEEGQNNIKGKIWEKALTRLICSLLSLPTPPENLHGVNGDSTSFSSRYTSEYDQKRAHKLLLLGLEGAGTSAIFKQAKFLYGSKFSSEELQNIKVMIQTNMYVYLGMLLEGREHFEEELNRKNWVHHADGENEAEQLEHSQCVYSISPKLKSFSDWLLKIIAMGNLETFFPAAAREYAPLADEAWKSAAVQETYKRRNELHLLPDVASYFLDRVIEISSNEYEPSERDILYAEGITQSNGLAFVEFSLEDRSAMSEAYTENLEYAPPPLTKYQLIRISSRGLNGECKWLEMFEDARVVLFCVALSEYDQMWSGGSGPLCNKMIASRELFESIVRHPSFKDVPFVLLLNKYDAFEEKIRKVPLTVCEWFGDFSPVKPHNNSQSLAANAFHYIAMKFKDLYASMSNRKLFVWQTKAHDRSTVDEAFKYVREVLKWEDMMDDNVFGTGDESFYSTEISTSPYIRQE